MVGLAVELKTMMRLLTGGELRGGRRVRQRPAAKKDQSEQGPERKVSKVRRAAVDAEQGWWKRGREEKEGESCGRRRVIALNERNESL